METKQSKYVVVEEPIQGRMGSLMGPILREHWEEVARNKELMVLKPDLNKYDALEKAGKLITLFAYRGEEIVGYSFSIIDNHLHYADLVVVYNDIIFVSKEHRNSPVGIKLIRETEKVAKTRGAKLMIWHAKENTSLDKILPKMKCKVQEIMYTKGL